MATFKLPQYLCKLCSEIAIKPNIRQIHKTANMSGSQGRKTETLFKSIAKRSQHLKDIAIQGTKTATPRRKDIPWNYNMELGCLNVRLSENVDISLLKVALSDKSYVWDEKQKMQEAGLTDVNIEDNSSLAIDGSGLIHSFTEKYFRWSWPQLPEDGIQSVVRHLNSTEVLGPACASIGFRQLILAREYPPTNDAYAKSLQAFIGALKQSSGQERCERFILDVVVAQSTNKDIWDLWEVEKPFEMVQAILSNSKLPAAEPRIIDSMGQDTLEAVYYIGLYCNKKFIGEGYGETPEIGKTTASLNALSRFFGVPPSRNTLDYGPISDEVALKDKPHSYSSAWKLPEGFL